MSARTFHKIDHSYRPMSLEKLLSYWTPERAAAWHADPDNRREQRISWAAGQLALSDSSLTFDEAVAITKAVVAAGG